MTTSQETKGPLLAQNQSHELYSSARLNIKNMQERQLKDTNDKSQSRKELSSIFILNGQNSLQNKQQKSKSVKRLAENPISNGGLIRDQEKLQTSRVTLEPIQDIIQSQLRSMSIEKGTLLKAAQTRQAIEKDEKLLENRVKMLQYEEQKILKKIDQTRKQAEKILNQKQLNEQHQKEKITNQMNQDQFIEQKREQQLKVKEESKQKFQANVQSIFEDKRNIYQDFKTQRIDGEQRKQQFLQQVVQENQQKKDKIKQMEKQTQEKLNCLWTNKVEQSQANYLDKLDKEKQLLETKAKNIAKMESLEDQLLLKLKTTQDKQKEAFSFLQNVLSNKNQRTKMAQSIDMKGQSLAGAYTSRGPYNSNSRKNSPYQQQKLL